MRSHSVLHQHPELLAGHQTLDYSRQSDGEDGDRLGTAGHRKERAMEAGSRGQSQIVSQVRTESEKHKRCRRLEDQDQHKVVLGGAGTMSSGACEASGISTVSLQAT